MIKYLILLIMISLNAMQFEGFKGKWQYMCQLNQSIFNANYLKEKYDLDFKNGIAQNDNYLAIVDANYQIAIYKRVKEMGLRKDESKDQAKL